MENQNQINFFWSGDEWSYLHDMTIKSHIKVGHEPVIWIHGDTPKSRHWDDRGITIRNADDIISISDFISKGGNFKTASSLWRFTFLYEYGGWYSDTDALAITTWPDQEWVLCSNYEDMISTGVLKVPSKEPMFLDMIDNLKLEWGNVKVFNTSLEKFKIDPSETIDGQMFFPFVWSDWEKWKSSLVDFHFKMAGVYSVHLYHTMFERAGMVDSIDEWISNNPDTLLGKIDRWVRE